MNRSEDNTCEYCKADLPREAVGSVHFCSFECQMANDEEVTAQTARYADNRQEAELAHAAHEARK